MKIAGTILNTMKVVFRITSRTTGIKERRKITLMLDKTYTMRSNIILIVVIIKNILKIYRMTNNLVTRTSKSSSSSMNWAIRPVILVRARTSIFNKNTINNNYNRTIDNNINRTDNITNRTTSNIATRIDNNSINNCSLNSININNNSSSLNFSNNISFRSIQYKLVLINRTNIISIQGSWIRRTIVICRYLRTVLKVTGNCLENWAILWKWYWYSLNSRSSRW